MLNNRTAKLLSSEELYPSNANTPTVYKRYECPCGKGFVEYGYVPGFRDYWAEIRCDSCQERYRLITGQGSLWELKEK